MAQKWYPVIDYLECAECGSCIAKCSHGVYDKAKAPSPLVINPGNCIDHCHGCGNLCPKGAITYVGDDTGWAPPNGSHPEGKPCCAPDCGCAPEKDSSDHKAIAIDFLYLDLKTCERCMGTDDALMDAINEVGAVLTAAGYAVVLNKIEIEDAQMAEQYRFLSSPTIRINGKDICLDVKENSCGSCSDISNQPTNCRIFVYEGTEYEVPPKAMIINAILSAVYGREQNAAQDDPYALPENLKLFFEGKKNNAEGLCCGGSACGC